jgi:hypothetical protein
VDEITRSVIGTAEMLDLQALAGAPLSPNLFVIIYWPSPRRITALSDEARFRRCPSSRWRCGLLKLKIQIVISSVN